MAASQRNTSYIKKVEYTIQQKMSLKGHMVLSGATLNLLKTECLKEHGREAAKKMTETRVGGKDIRRPPMPSFCFPLIYS